jgi:hypothetical protein
MSIWIPNILCNVLMSKSRYNREMTRKSCDFSLVRPQVTMLLVGWELLTFSGHLTPSDFSLGRPQVTMLLVVWKLLTFPGHLTPGTSYSRDILPPVLVDYCCSIFSFLFVFCRSFFDFIFFFFCPLYCLWHT